MGKRYLYKENIIKKIGSGIESDVFLYNENGKDVALKLFKNINTVNNKELKLMLLKEKKELLNEFKIRNRIYNKDKFIGYTLDYKPAENFDDYIIEGKKKKIEIINKLQEKYQMLNENDVYIGDFNLENFGYSNGNIILYDIDNYSVDGLPFDVLNPFMKDYFKKCNKVDNIDYYTFNYFTLSFISGILPNFLTIELIQDGLPKDFKNKDCEKIYHDLIYMTDNYKKEKFIDGDDVTFVKCMKKGLFY